MDFSVNLGSARYLRANTTRLGNFLDYENHFFLSAGIRAGVAFGKNYELSDNLVCPIFKCYTDRKSALKINMVKLWSVGFSDFLAGGNRNQLYINLSPNVSYEIKLAKSPLSFEQDLDMHLYLSGNRTLVDSGFGLNTYNIKYHAGFRYYNGMRKRIRKGQSGNNLSGAYSFARVRLEQYSSLDFVQDLQTDIYLLQRNINKGVALQAGIGYQKAVLERLYFDVGMGARKDIKLNLNRALAGIRLDIYTKVGWMF